MNEQIAASQTKYADSPSEASDVLLPKADAEVQFSSLLDDLSRLLAIQHVASISSETARPAQ